MIHVILQLAIVGFLLYLIVTYVPMPQPIKIAILALATIILVVWLMDVMNIADIPMIQFRR